MWHLYEWDPGKRKEKKYNFNFKKKNFVREKEREKKSTSKSEFGDSLPPAKDGKDAANDGQVVNGCLNGVQIHESMNQESREN